MGVIVPVVIVCDCQFHRDTHVLVHQYTQKCRYIFIYHILPLCLQVALLKERAEKVGKDMTGVGGGRGDMVESP